MQLEAELNENIFYRRLVPSNEPVLGNIAQKCAETRESAATELTIRCVDGSLLPVVVDSDYVDNALGDVKCILCDTSLCSVLPFRLKPSGTMASADFSR